MRGLARLPATLLKLPVHAYRWTLKPWLGHTLGACGLSETLLLLAALRRGALPTLDYASEALLPLPSVRSNI